MHNLSTDYRETIVRTENLKTKLSKTFNLQYNRSLETFKCHTNYFSWVTPAEGAVNPVLTEHLSVPVF